MNWKGLQLPRRVSGLRLAALSVLSSFIALGLAACTQVAGSSSPSLVRVIDAAYNGPPVNVSAEDEAIAANIGRGSITGYGTLAGSNDAAIAITAANNGATLASAQAPLLPGKQQSILLASKAGAESGYTVTVLSDRDIAAPAGESSFRFLNQAPATGTIDIYMVPSGSTLAKSKPLVTSLEAGSIAGYISFASQTVSLVVTAAGSRKAKYTSPPIGLSGGEVRTVLILDSSLTSNPAVQAVIGDDVN